MSKKELYEVRTKAFMYMAILSAILLNASIITNDLIGKIFFGLSLVASMFMEYHCYMKLIRILKRRR